MGDVQEETTMSEHIQSTYFPEWGTFTYMEKGVTLATYGEILLPLMANFTDVTMGVTVVGEEARHHTSGNQTHTSFRCEPRKYGVERSRAPKTNFMVHPVTNKYGLGTAARFTWDDAMMGRLVPATDATYWDILAQRDVEKHLTFAEMTDLPSSEAM